MCQHAAQAIARGGCVEPVRAVAQFDMGDPAAICLLVYERVELTGRIGAILTNFCVSVAPYAYGLAKQVVDSGRRHADDLCRIIVDRHGRSNGSLWTRGGLLLRGHWLGVKPGGLPVGGVGSGAVCASGQDQQGQCRGDRSPFCRPAAASPIHRVRRPVAAVMRLRLSSVAFTKPGLQAEKQHGAQEDDERRTCKGEP